MRATKARRQSVPLYNDELEGTPYVPQSRTSSRRRAPSRDIRHYIHGRDLANQRADRGVPRFEHDPQRALTYSIEEELLRTLGRLQQRARAPQLDMRFPRPGSAPASHHSHRRSNDLYADAGSAGDDVYAEEPRIPALSRHGGGGHHTAPQLSAASHRSGAMRAPRLPLPPGSSPSAAVVQRRKRDLIDHALMPIGNFIGVTDYLVQRPQFRYRRIANYNDAEDAEALFSTEVPVRVEPLLLPPGSPSSHGNGSENESDSQTSSRSSSVSTGASYSVTSSSTSASANSAEVFFDARYAPLDAYIRGKLSHSHTPPPVAAVVPVLDRYAYRVGGSRLPVSHRPHRHSSSPAAQPYPLPFYRPTRPPAGVGGVAQRNGRRRHPRASGSAASPGNGWVGEGELAVPTTEIAPPAQHNTSLNSCTSRQSSAAQYQHRGRRPPASAEAPSTLSLRLTRGARKCSCCEVPYVPHPPSARPAEPPVASDDRHRAPPHSRHPVSRDKSEQASKRVPSETSTSVVSLPVESERVPSGRGQSPEQRAGQLLADAFLSELARRNLTAERLAELLTSHRAHSPSPPALTPPPAVAAPERSTPSQRSHCEGDRSTPHRPKEDGSLSCDRYAPQSLSRGTQHTYEVVMPAPPPPRPQVVTVGVQTDAPVAPSPPPAETATSTKATSTELSPHDGDYSEPRRQRVHTPPNAEAPVPTPGESAHSLLDRSTASYSYSYSSQSGSGIGSSYSTRSEARRAEAQSDVTPATASPEWVEGAQHIEVAAPPVLLPDSIHTLLAPPTATQQYLPSPTIDASTNGSNNTPLGLDTLRDSLTQAPSTAARSGSLLREEKTVPGWVIVSTSRIMDLELHTPSGQGNPENTTEKAEVPPVMDSFALGRQAAVMTLEQQGRSTLERQAVNEYRVIQRDAVADEEGTARLAVETAAGDAAQFLESAFRAACGLLRAAEDEQESRDAIRTSEEEARAEMNTARVETEDLILLHEKQLHDVEDEEWDSRVDLDEEETMNWVNLYLEMAAEWLEELHGVEAALLLKADADERAALEAAECTERTQLVQQQSNADDAAQEKSWEEERVNCTSHEEHGRFSVEEEEREGFEMLTHMFDALYPPPAIPVTRPSDAQKPSESALSTEEPQDPPFEFAAVERTSPETVEKGVTGPSSEGTNDGGKETDDTGDGAEKLSHTSSSAALAEKGPHSTSLALHLFAPLEQEEASLREAIAETESGVRDDLQLRLAIREEECGRDDVDFTEQSERAALWSRWNAESAGLTYVVPGEPAPRSHSSASSESGASSFSSAPKKANVAAVDFTSGDSSILKVEMTSPNFTAEAVEVVVKPTADAKEGEDEEKKSSAASTPYRPPSDRSVEDVTPLPPPQTDDDGAAGEAVAAESGGTPTPGDHLSTSGAERRRRQRPALHRIHNMVDVIEFDEGGMVFEKPTPSLPRRTSGGNPPTAQAQQPSAPSTPMVSDHSAGDHEGGEKESGEHDEGQHGGGSAKKGFDLDVGVDTSPFAPSPIYAASPPAHGDADDHPHTVEAGGGTPHRSAAVDSNTPSPVLRPSPRPSALIATGTSPVVVAAHIAVVERSNLEESAESMVTPVNRSAEVKPLRQAEPDLAGSTRVAEAGTAEVNVASVDSRRFLSPESVARLSLTGPLDPPMEVGAAGVLEAEGEGVKKPTGPPPLAAPLLHIGSPSSNEIKQASFSSGMPSGGPPGVSATRSALLPDAANGEVDNHEEEEKAAATAGLGNEFSVDSDEEGDEDKRPVAAAAHIGDGGDGSEKKVSQRSPSGDRVPLVKVEDSPLVTPTATADGSSVEESVPSPVRAMVERERLQFMEEDALQRSQEERPETPVFVRQSARVSDAATEPPPHSEPPVDQVRNDDDGGKKDNDSDVADTPLLPPPHVHSGTPFGPPLLVRTPPSDGPVVPENAYRGLDEKKDPPVSSAPHGMASGSGGAAAYAPRPGPPPPPLQIRIFGAQDLPLHQLRMEQAQQQQSPLPPAPPQTQLKAWQVPPSSVPHKGDSQRRRSSEPESTLPPQSRQRRYRSPPPPPRVAHHSDSSENSASSGSLPSGLAPPPGVAIPQRGEAKQGGKRPEPKANDDDEEDGVVSLKSEELRDAGIRTAVPLDATHTPEL